jgi:hypothetical protein
MADAIARPVDVHHPEAISERSKIGSPMPPKARMKIKVSFLVKLTVFTPQFAASHPSYFTRDASFRIVGLNGRTFKRQRSFQGRVYGSCRSSTKGIGAIQRKKSSGSLRL